ncbi:MAG: response regulator [Candidatus Polarisedimenticolia bacterium]
MRILIAEDDPVSLRVLQATLEKASHEVVAARDGNQALAGLRAGDGPRLAVLDWMMPGLDGTEVCRRVRQDPAVRGAYLILLTARGRKEDVLAGLRAGADDYVTKPFDQEELMARVQVGMRILDLQSALADRVRELEEALASVRVLRGLLPICSYCKKVRDDRNYWQQVETYVSDHTDARFSHGICPDCYEKVVKPQMEQTLPPAGGKKSP